MERKETMSYHQAPFFRKTSFTLVISKWRIWFFYIHCKREYCTSPLSKHFTNYSETKKIWIILQLIYSSGRCKADICDLPFEDNQYDVILCNHVLEHIPDDTKAMQELYRVLKPGGWPFYKSLKSYQEL
jgi:cell fate regulator YaaT (PSP1 superfamily)